MRVLAALGAGLFWVTGALADWPQFLGPDRNGVSTETIALAADVPGDEGVPRLWSRPVGTGLAGPVVSRGRCLLFHREDGQARVDSLNARSGELQWTFSYPTDYVDGFGMDPGPRSCPTVTEDRVFIYGAEGQIHALSLEDGRLLWKRDLAAEFDSPPGFFGRCSAPLVSHGLVMVDAGGRHKGKPVTVWAFDTQTGELKWTAGESAADYASAVLLPPQATSDTPSLALFFVREGFLGIELPGGAVRFQEPFRSSITASVNAASPVTIGNRFFLSSCYGTGAGLWQWSEPDGLETLYKREGALDCHFATPVHVEGYLYGFHGRQETGQELRCVSLDSAQVQWNTELPAGSVIAADGKLLVLTERGELLVGKTDPKAWQIHYRAQITGADTRAMPALAGGRLYARDKRRLTCVDLGLGQGG